MKRSILEHDLATLARLPELEPAPELDEMVKLRMFEELAAREPGSAELEAEPAGNVPRLEAAVHFVVVAAYSVYALDFVIRAVYRFIAG